MYLVKYIFPVLVIVDEGKVSGDVQENVQAEKDQRWLKKVRP